MNEIEYSRIQLAIDGLTLINVIDNQPLAEAVMYEMNVLLISNDINITDYSYDYNSITIYTGITIINISLIKQHYDSKLVSIIIRYGTQLQYKNISYINL